ncbi:endonuclease VII [Morganella phage vB_MmoM_MP1]|uniref:Recombinase endonuclease VII n=1 Tax=Morganella phage vB_MmoM_MP1 TaxID=1852628 RepID=A0A192YCA9_9CAUD|nr:endonuclease VII [Morganella phage vB_MmoM_MP1]ANM46501.1 recombinase endonuclease VII [Morganella phage vB_MmoM_MP1]
MLLTGKLYKEEKESMFKAQQGLCLICGLELDKDVQKNHLDHDHALDGDKAGKVRGLLCNLCNGTEGQMKHKFNRSGLKSKIDYIEWMENLLSYLKSDYTQNNIHPQYVVDKSKEFSRLSKDDMISIMQCENFEYNETDTKTDLVKKYKKYLRKSLK